MTALEVPISLIKTIAHIEGVCKGLVSKGVVSKGIARCVPVLLALSLSQLCLADLSPVLTNANNAGASAAEYDYLAQVGSVSRISMPAKSGSLYSQSGRELTSSMRSAWRQASEDNKVVMMVLGAESCDRCLLLDKYISSAPLKPRIDKHFVVLNMGIDALGDEVDVDIESEHLPAIVLVQSGSGVSGLFSTEKMLTFMPEPHEALFDWMESLLFYSDQVFSVAPLRHPAQDQSQLSGG